MNRLLDVTTSVLGTVARFGYGAQVGELGPRPEKPLELYEFEACPFCRKVREALSVLDLDANVYPCPKGGPRFRRVVRERGGKELFPYLIDPNRDVEMFESDDIVSYLFGHYGSGQPPLALTLGPITYVSEIAVTAFRLGGGGSYRQSKPPEKPLELWSYEASPFCRIVREALCELEIPYRLHNVARQSPKRKEFVARSGKMMVPYLVDPNHDAAMFESADIVAYLERTYGAS